eukprot:jgi/Hompol1/3641/HPOL_000273-RA
MRFELSPPAPDDPDIHTVWMSTIVSVDRKFPTSDGLFPVYLTCRHFLCLKLFFARDSDAVAVYTALQRGTNITSLNQVYAFTYYRENAGMFPSAGWSVYDPQKEFGKRMGVGTDSAIWRLSTINQNFEFSPTYPSIIGVPSRISDNVLKHIGGFRSKSRIPALSYIHALNKVSLTRCAQPMVGLKQSRSIQDEKLVEAIFASSAVVPTPGHVNLIIDARPTTNAIAQTAMGAGTESAENYKGSRIVYLGIDNIHVVRDSMNKLFDAFVSVDSLQVSKSALERSGWLRHIRNILEGTLQIVQSIHVHNAHVLVHCSDGWDRTAQLSSLAQICLDPYYRTIDGLQVLLEKEWVAFGHKFKDRSGHLCHERYNGASDSPSAIGNGGGTSIGPANPYGSDRGNRGPSVATQLQTASKQVSASFTNAAKSLLGGSKIGLFGMSSSFSSETNVTSYQSSGMNNNGSGGGGISSISTNATAVLASSETLTPNNVAPREISPIFTQFLDCNARIQDTTVSIWDYISLYKQDFLNPVYLASEGSVANAASGEEVATVHKCHANQLVLRLV